MNCRILKAVSFDEDRQRRSWSSANTLATIAALNPASVDAIRSCEVHSRARGTSVIFNALWGAAQFYIAVAHAEGETDRNLGKLVDPTVEGNIYQDIAQGILDARLQQLSRAIRHSRGANPTTDGRP